MYVIAFARIGNITDTIDVETYGVFPTEQQARKEAENRIWRMCGQGVWHTNTLWIGRVNSVNICVRINRHVIVGE